MSTCKRCGCEFDYDLTRGTGYAPDLCGAFCDGVYSERKVSALKIAGLMTQIDELRDERDALATELARLRRLEEAASTMYYTNHGSPEWDTAYNMLMEAIDEREEAAREAEKARGV